MSKKSDKSRVAAALHALAATLRERHPPGQLMARAKPELDALQAALEQAGDEVLLGPTVEVLVPFLRGRKGPAAAQAALLVLEKCMPIKHNNRALEVLDSPELLAALTSCLRSPNCETAAAAARPLRRMVQFKGPAVKYLDHDPGVIDLLAGQMLSGAPREGLQAVGCSVASPRNDDEAASREAAWAAANIIISCSVGPEPRMEDAATALLWTSNAGTAQDASEIVRCLLQDHGKTGGGRRLAARASLAAGLRELLGCAAAASDSQANLAAAPAWGRAAKEGLRMAHTAMDTLVYAIDRDSKVLRLAAALEALTSAVVTSRVLQVHHCFQGQPRAAADAYESACQALSDAARRALECQWLQRQRQQEQQQQAKSRGTRQPACAFCGKTRAAGATLRGCRGCSRYTGVRYCSQACCEAHWAKRRHRRLCEMAQAYHQLQTAFSTLSDSAEM